MSRIKSSHTKPEQSFRKYIWSKGVRGYRLHKKIKGRPDIYFPTKKTAVFIDGCFWHYCPICYRAPKNNKGFWQEKIKKNVNRDLDTDIFLKDNGVEVLRFWEHDIKHNIHQCFNMLQQKLLNTKAWNKNVKVEENGYYHKGFPLITKGNTHETKGPIVVELFSGCGGTSTGFEMANYNIALGLDIHTPSLDTFKYNHPGAATILGDISAVTAESIKKIIGNRKIDVLIGGIPCQGFSLNNRKRHAKDERNFLYLEFLRMVRELNPKIVVLENVGGLKKMSNGEFVKKIKNGIAEAGDMKVTHDMLYAPHFGVPQKRERLVFVGIRRGKEFNFSDIKHTHGPGTGKPYVTIAEAISDLPSLKAGNSKDNYGSEPCSNYQKLMRSYNKANRLLNHIAPRHPENTIKKIQKTKPGTPLYPRFKQRIRLAWDDLSPTQVSGGIRPQFQFGHPADARGLTVRERCRIQSFPDNFFICGGTCQGRVQTGNAVPPLLAKAIAEALKQYL